jgi:putative DNA primase/helicase
MWENIENQLTPGFIEGIYSEVRNKKQTGDEIKGLCPFHDDKHPSFTFNPSKNGVYKCHSGKCGATGNFITYLKEIKKVDPVEWLKDNLNMAYEPIKKVKTEQKEIKIISPSIIGEASTNLLNNQSKLEFLHSLGITDEVIKKLDIGYKEGRYWLPIKDKKGSFVNIRKYEPGNEKYKFLNYTRKYRDKDGELKTETGYGVDRLYPIDSLEDDEVYIFEGEKDTLLALSLGLNAITNTCGCESFNKEWGPLFEGKTVYICMDIDEAGQKGAKKREKIIKKYAESVVNIILDIDKEKYPKGDFHDYIMKEGKTVEDFLEVCKDPLSCVSNKDLLIALKMMKEHDLFHLEDQSFYKYTANNYWEVFSPLNMELLIEDCLIDNKIDPTEYKVNTVFKKIRRRSLVSPEIVREYNENLINFKNGVLDLTTYELKNHSKEYYFTQKLDHNYNPDLIDNYTDNIRIWTKFLNDIFYEDQEVIDLLQEIFGYCFSADNSFHKAFIFNGSGRNGKGTVMNALENIIGKSNVSNVSFNNLSKDSMRVNLQNKLLNSSGEIDFSVVSSSDQFKKIVGGDAIDARDLYKSTIFFRPYCKLIFATNDLPQTKDKTDGYYERLMIVPFKKYIKREDRDLDLGKKIAKEYEGIIAWSLSGLKRLRDRGKFTDPKACEDELVNYKYESNSLMQFVDEGCYLDELEKCDKPAFICAYKMYCKENQIGAYKTPKITKELMKLYGVEQRKSNSLRYYKGIKLIKEPTQELVSSFGSYID